MSLKIFHNPRCSKSRATLQLLQDNGYEPEVVLYLESPPGRKELETILASLRLNARDLMRKSEQEYQQLGLDRDSLSEDELLTAILNHPRLMERPIVVHNGRAAIGRPPESVLGIL